ncbi:MAG: NUDIX domain-containing protein [Novosphingobium sp.]|nr:NUDIX domain-containing protein [Novosphingobium sp.]
MAQRSAGVLLYRRTGRAPEVLLVRPGGPFWRNKDVGAWQIPKGCIEPGETPEQAARREVEEELGVALTGELEPLATIRQAGGKIVEAFALEYDLDPAAIRSNLFSLEWPRGSGRMAMFPEVEEARWFTLDQAEAAILKSQLPLLASLGERL